MTKEIIKKFGDIDLDYKTLFALCLAYLLENQKEVEGMKITEMKKGVMYVLKNDEKVEDITLPAGTPIMINSGKGLGSTHDFLVAGIGDINYRCTFMGLYYHSFENGENTEVEVATKENIVLSDSNVMVVYQILGETYSIKEQIKKDGGKFNWDKKFWYLLEENDKYDTKLTLIFKR